VTFSVWAKDSASKRNKFLAFAEMENLLLISSEKEWKTWYEEISWIMVTTLRCIRVPGSRPFFSILIPITCPCVQSDGLSTVKFTVLQVRGVQFGAGVWEHTR
jgi:hypothetical protein